MLVRDLRDYPWSSYMVYGHGKEDGITDRHEIYESIGREPNERYKVYREYVLSNRDKEEREIREKMGKGVMGSERFRESVENKVIERGRKKRGRPRK